MEMKPVSQIKARLGINKGGKVEKFLVDTCAKHMDKYVPFDRGNLAKYYIQGNYIIYDQRYAHYQYVGISHSGKPLNYQRDKHPLATSYWDKKMVSAEMRDVEKEVQNYVNRGR